MSFLQPLALAGLILALTPLIIHLLNLLRHRSQPWAATRFLFQARKSSSRMSKIKRWLTLLFRILALACLTLMIARPISGGDFFLSLSSRSPEVLVFILDRSASMESVVELTSKSKRQHAIEIFQRFIEPWPESKIVLVESVYEEPFFIHGSDSLKDKSYEHFICSTDTAASLPKTILKTLRWMKESQIGSAEILIASDMQKSNWVKKESADQFIKIDQILTEKNHLWTLKIVPFQSPPPYNLSVRIDNIQKNKENLKPSIILNRKNSKKPSSMVNIETQINGKSQSHSLKINSNLTRWNPELTFEQEIEQGWGSIQLGNDFCNSDNQCFFTYNTKSIATVGVRSSNPNIGIILRSAAQNKEGEQAGLISLQNLQESELRSKKILIQQGTLSLKENVMFEKFIKNGGTLIAFPSEEENSIEFSFLNWQKLESKIEEDSFSVRDWAKENSVLANFVDGSELPLEYLSIQKRRIPNQGEPLAYYQDGKAFLSKFTYGNGLIYAFSTLPLDSWSSLKDGFILVPIIQRIIQESSPISTESNDMICGSEESKQIFEYTSVDLPAQKSPSINAGVYQINGQLTSINRPILENEDETLSFPELNLMLPNSSPIQQLKTQDTFSLKRSEIWTTFLFLTLLFLLGETLLGLPTKLRRKN